jgi:hypothetical protein
MIVVFALPGRSVRKWDQRAGPVEKIIEGGKSYALSQGNCADDYHVSISNKQPMNDWRT